MRALLLKVEHAFETKKEPSFSPVEKLMLEKAIKLELVHKDAFIPTPAQGDVTQTYRQSTKNYPLTPKGHEIVAPNLYQRFRKSFLVQIISDGLLVTAFLLTLWLTCNQVFGPTKQSDAKTGTGIAVESPQALEPTAGEATATPPK